MTTSRLLEAKHLEAKHLESKHLEATHLEATHLEATHLEATRLESTRLESERAFETIITELEMLLTSTDALQRAALLDLHASLAVYECATTPEVLEVPFAMFGRRNLEWRVASRAKRLLKASGSTTMAPDRAAQNIVARLHLIDPELESMIA